MRHERWAVRDLLRWVYYRLLDVMFALRLRLAFLSRMSPIVVYQMGKVGSVTICESLRAARLGRPVVHVHYLTPDGIRNAMLCNIDAKGLYSPMRSWTSRYVRHRLDHNLEKGIWTVISLVREPVARNISAFFENLANTHQDLGSDRQQPGDLIARLQMRFLETYNHRVPLTWFDDEVKPTFGIDVYT